MESTSLNKREYLRSQGFHVGERGRFTPAMLTALTKSGIDFKETLDKPEPLDVSCVVDTVSFLQPESTAIREPRTLYGYNREGKKIGFVICYACKLHMMYCDCESIQAPPSIIHTKESDVRVSIKNF